MCGQCLIFSRHFIYWAATNLAFYLLYPTTDTESAICFRVKASENAEIHILSKLRSRILFFFLGVGERLVVRQIRFETTLYFRSIAVRSRWRWMASDDPQKYRFCW